MRLGAVLRHIHSRPLICFLPLLAGLLSTAPVESSLALTYYRSPLSTAIPSYMVRAFFL